MSAQLYLISSLASLLAIVIVHDINNAGYSEPLEMGSFDAACEM